MEAMELEPMLLLVSAEGDGDDDVTKENDSDNDNDNHHHHHPAEEVVPSSSISYWQLLRDNRPFTLYLLSYITNHTGEWLTYLASLTALHDMGSSSSSSTLIGALVAVRLLTNVAASPWGGALADARDRRHVMIVLDLVGAGTAWVFVAAVYVQSPTLIFVATALQEIESGLYEPSRSAMVPLLCPSSSPGQLEKATLLTGMAWSAVAAVGSATGGVLVSWLGMQGCFLVDSATYLVSAWLMTCVGGQWNVAVDASKRNNDEKNQQSTQETPWSMVVSGWTYLRATTWGPLVLLKFSVLWLTMDVLMVDFANRTGNTDPEQAPMRMGALFGAVGVGCLIGPPLVDQFTSLQRPATVQVAAVAALGLSTMACALISLNLLGNPLWLLCCFTVLRSFGVAVLWIQASLLLQELSAPEYLGRVLSMDYGLALLGEAANAIVTGRLRDAAHWSPEQVCAWLATLGFFFTAAWTVYTCRGGGAMSLSPAAKKASEPRQTDEDEPTENWRRKGGYR